MSGGTPDGLLVTGSVGTLVNTGLISSSSGDGINVQGGSVTSIVNQGVIGSTAIGGSGIANTGTIGSILNAGTVIANSGTAILNSGSIGTITNTSSGLISGQTAIDNTAGGRLTINTAGTIVGPIKLGANADVLNITGGTIAGAIAGQSGSGDTINFNTTGSFTTGGSIANVDTLSVNAGAVTIANPVTGALLFAIQQGASATLAAPVSATAFNNSGLLNVGSTTATINGNYNQTSTGQLGVTVTGSGSGSLTVTGTATVAGHSDAIVVNVATNRNIFGQRYNFISAGSLVVSNIGLLSVSDNDPLVDFDVSQIGNQFLLNAVAPTRAEALSAANNLIFGIGMPAAKSAGLGGLAYANGVAIGTALSDLLTFNVLRGNDTLYNTLSGLSASQWNQLFNQLVPSFVGRSQALLVTSMVGAGPWLGAVERRLSITRGPDGQVSGLAAGDDPAPGISAWIHPYGAFSSQDQKDGVAGYNANMYGVALGADTAVRPDVRVGLAIELGNTDVRYNNMLQGNSDSIFTAQLSAYGTWRFADNFFLDGQLTYAHSSFDTTNEIAPLSTQLKASYGGNTLTGRVGLGYVWRSDNLSITPLVSLQQYHFGIDSYSTSGGGAAGIDEHVNGQTINITQPRIGSSVSYRFVYPGAYTVIPEMHLYYMHNFGDDHSTINGSFVASGSSFQTVTPTFGKDIVNIGGGVTVMQKGPWSVSLTYDHSDAGSAREDIFFFRVRAQF